jgi:hypothetical protein
VCERGAKRWCERKFDPGIHPSAPLRVRSDVRNRRPWRGDSRAPSVRAANHGPTVVGLRRDTEMSLPAGGGVVGEGRCVGGGGRGGRGRGRGWANVRRRQSPRATWTAGQLTAHASVTHDRMPNLTLDQDAPNLPHTHLTASHTTGVRDQHFPDLVRVSGAPVSATLGPLFRSRAGVRTSVGARSGVAQQGTPRSVVGSTLAANT